MSMHRRLQQAGRAGEITQEELKRRRGLVYAAVTPRELWKASGHQAGSPERSDKASCGARSACSWPSSSSPPS